MIRRKAILLDAVNQSVRLKTLDPEDVGKVIRAENINSMDITIGSKSYEAFFDADGELISGCPISVMKNDEEPFLYGNVLLYLKDGDATNEDKNLVKDNAVFDSYNHFLYLLI